MKPRVFRLGAVSTLVILIWMSIWPKALLFASKAPEIVYFTADSYKVQPGGTIRLRWEIANAPSARITGPDQATNYDMGVGLPTEGLRDIALNSLPVPDNNVVQFVLTLVEADGVTPVTRADGSVINQTLSVTVETGISINSFTADPPIADREQTINVSWSTTGASAVTLDILEGKWPGPGSGQKHPPTGSMRVHISPGRYYDIVLRLIPEDAHGRGLMRYLRVPIRCPYQYFFGQLSVVAPPNSSDGEERWDYLLQSCPLGAPQHLAGVFQPFERGLLIWRSDKREAYLLYTDPDRFEGRSFLIFRNQDTLPEEPRRQTAELPPDRFVKQWTPELQLRLGQVTAPAQNYLLTAQAVAIEPYQTTISPQPTFFSLPTGGVVVLDFALSTIGKGHWAYFRP